MQLFRFTWNDPDSAGVVIVLQTFLSDAKATAERRTGRKVSFDSSQPGQCNAIEIVTTEQAPP